jgi:hypothetical protein
MWQVKILGVTLSPSLLTNFQCAILAPLWAVAWVFLGLVTGGVLSPLQLPCSLKRLTTVPCLPSSCVLYVCLCAGLHARWWCFLLNLGGGLHLEVGGFQHKPVWADQVWISRLYWVGSLWLELMVRKLSWLGPANLYTNKWGSSKWILTQPRN